MIMDTAYLNNKNPSYKKRTTKSDNLDEEVSLNNYLNIWQDNPSFKDINTRVAILKTFFLIFITTFFITSSFIHGLALIHAFIMGIIVLICFLLVFHDSLFRFQTFFRFGFRNFTTIDPYENLTFFFIREDSETLFFTNKKDLKTCAMSMFQVQTIAENISPAQNQFIKSLNEVKIPYSFQVAQAPVIDFASRNSGNYISKKMKELDMSFKTCIYFSVFNDINGKLTQSKIEILKERLREYRDVIRSNFSGNFYHFSIKLLSGNELLKALKFIILKNHGDQDYESDIRSSESALRTPIGKNSLIKIIFCIFLSIYWSYQLFLFDLSFYIIALSNLVLFLILFFLWWRNIFFLKFHLINNEEVTLVSPFKNTTFYRFKAHPDSIFYHINNRVLGGLKMTNIIHAAPVFHIKQPFCFPDKLYRALIEKKTPFVYTLTAFPISYYTFDKEAYKYLNTRGKNSLLDIETNKQGEKWLAMRDGVWKTMITVSVNSYLITSFLKSKYVDIIEQDLKRKTTDFKNNFAMYFRKFELISLKNQELISGYLFETVKNRFFRYGGTYLNYLFFQGKALVLLAEISAQFKKGVETRIAAEFNTPLQLDNFVSFGHTFNTEFMEKEVAAGLLLEQLHNLLVVNGTSKSREDLIMKIVSELVKVKIPSLIFDFSGRWSKLIKDFIGSDYEDDFLYFKLGSAFTIDPIRSEVPYDKENIAYLDYMFDAYALAFKKPEKLMNIFKNTIQRNPDIDMATLNLDLKNQQSWQKNSMTGSLISLFDEFTNQDYLSMKSSETKESITFQDFIKDDRTVIIDLSISNDYKKQIFITFVILSKIIHYIHSFDKFIPKIIVSPRIDLFFDGQYLDNPYGYANYGTVDKFLEPFIQEGFGMIFSANQIRYLHSNIFNYFHNLISFRATEKGDISVLKNQLNLQELHGIGYYTPSRNNTYQVDYLKSQKNEEVLIKRSDLYQTFPAIIDVEKVKNITPMRYGDIVEYMKRQGYDLMHTEKRLLEQTKKTIFNKDLGSYIVFLDEIIKFLEAIKSLDNIGNLYEVKLKKQLKGYIHQKAIKITKDKRRLKELRDEIFELLVKHSYLEEKHPKMAGGGEALRTSYAVGEKYSKALEDYFSTKKNSLTNISIETIAKERKDQNNIKEIFPLNSEDRPISKNNGFEKILIKTLGDFYYTIFQIYRYIRNKEYSKAIEEEKHIIKNFLLNLYRECFHVNYVVTQRDLEKFIPLLCQEKLLPFTQDELQYYLGFHSRFELDELNLEDLAKDAYQTFKEFFDKIQMTLDTQEGI